MMKNQNRSLSEKESYPETIELPSEKRALRKAINTEIATRGLSITGGEIPFKLLPPQKEKPTFTVMPTQDFAELEEE